MKIGIDLGGTNIRMASVENGTIVQKISEKCLSNGSENEVLEQIKTMLRTLIDSRTTQIGIGVPSVVDVERGIVYNTVNIPSWKEVRLKEALEKEFGIPVKVNNDCNCFALGEALYGKSSQFNDVVFIAIGTGVGAGIIIDKKLYCGQNAGAGEIGCIPYLEHNLEYYCSSRFFEQYAMTGKEAYDQAKISDPKALKIWDEMGKHLGNLLLTTLYAYDPEAIVFGGSISHAYEYFSESMLRLVHEKFDYPESLKKLKIFVSNDADIALLGAASL